MGKQIFYSIKHIKYEVIQHNIIFNLKKTSRGGGGGPVCIFSFPKFLLKRLGDHPRSEKNLGRHAGSW